MRRLFSSAALLCVTIIHVTTSSLAADVQIEEHTLCREALHAFDVKDLAGIQDFLDFIKNVFKALDAQYTNAGERSVSVAVAGPVVRGFCQQHLHPRSTTRQRGLIAACTRRCSHQQVSPPRFYRQVKANPAFDSNNLVMPLPSPD